jgi:hypothetical protein
MLHRCRSFLTSLSLFLLTGLVPLSASSQVPHDMAYQGVLTDAVGAPLTGPVTLVFRVFDLPSGGTPLYTETHSGVAIDSLDGSFLVQLGLGTTDLDTDGDGAAETNLHAFDASLFENGPNRYLEIQVGSGVGGEILDPRQIIGSVPYALVAEDVVTDPATSTVGALIAAAQTAIANAQTTADAAQATADAVVETQLSEAEVDAFVANNGYVTVDTNTQLSETEVVAIVANNGFASNQDVATQAAQLASLVSLVDPSVNDRFQACSDGLTVADTATGLLWERKTGTVGSGAGGNCNAPGSCVDPHDVNNRYSWTSTGSAADGPAFTTFLEDLNGGSGFAGHTGWRLPVISEWQSIMVGPGVVNTSVNAVPADPEAGSNPTGQATTCSVSPCVDPEFAARVGPTASLSGSGNWYWSASSMASDSAYAYTAVFRDGLISPIPIVSFLHVRAVRAGSCSPSAPLAEQVAATDVVVSGLETAVGLNQTAIQTLEESVSSNASEILSAQTTAANAQTTAANAQTTADAAQTTADAAAGSAACTQAGGTWDAGTSTCTPAAAPYNCFIGGFCSQAAIDFPPATFGYTNVFDGHTQTTEPALGAGCNASPGSNDWSVGAFPLSSFQVFGRLQPDYHPNHPHLSFQTTRCARTRRTCPVPLSRSVFV